jgi:fatty acid desaturase
MMNMKLSFVVWVVAGALLLILSIVLFWMHVSWWFSVPCLGAAIICLFLGFCCYILHRIGVSEDEEDDEEDKEDHWGDDDYCGVEYEENPSDTDR